MRRAPVGREVGSSILSATGQVVAITVLEHVPTPLPCRLGQSAVSPLGSPGTKVSPIAFFTLSHN